VGSDKGEGLALTGFRNSDGVPGRWFLALPAWMLRAASGLGSGMT
jgi:hypothetical protein